LSFQDELLQELEELEQEDVEKELLEVGTPSTEIPGLDSLPEVRKFPPYQMHQRCTMNNFPLLIYSGWIFFFSECVLKLESGIPISICFGDYN